MVVTDPAPRQRARPAGQSRGMAFVGPRCSRLVRFHARRLSRVFRGRDRGATMLEMVLLLAAVAIPSYFIIQIGLQILFAHYRLVTTINGLPFP